MQAVAQSLLALSNPQQQLQEQDSGESDGLGTWGACRQRSAAPFLQRRAETTAAAAGRGTWAAAAGGGAAAAASGAKVRTEACLLRCLASGLDVMYTRAAQLL